jgi:hypothetical protein
MIEGVKRRYPAFLRTIDFSESLCYRLSMRIYLDNCCFNRPYDDQSQIRIRIESEAKLFIQAKILAGEIELAWSYIL